MMASSNPLGMAQYSKTKRAARKKVISKPASSLPRQKVESKSPAINNVSQQVQPLFPTYIQASLDKLTQSQIELNALLDKFETAKKKKTSNYSNAKLRQHARELAREQHIRLPESKSPKDCWDVFTDELFEQITMLETEKLSLLSDHKAREQKQADLETFNTNLVKAIRDAAQAFCDLCNQNKAGIKFDITDPEIFKEWLEVAKIFENFAKIQFDIKEQKFIKIDIGSDTREHHQLISSFAEIVTEANNYQKISDAKNTELLTKKEAAKKGLFCLVKHLKPLIDEGEIFVSEDRLTKIELTKKVTDLKKEVDNIQCQLSSSIRQSDLRVDRLVVDSLSLKSEGETFTDFLREADQSLLKKYDEEYEQATAEIYAPLNDAVQLEKALSHYHNFENDPDPYKRQDALNRLVNIPLTEQEWPGFGRTQAAIKIANLKKRFGAVLDEDKVLAGLKEEYEQNKQKYKAVKHQAELVRQKAPELQARLQKSISEQEKTVKAEERRQLVEELLDFIKQMLSYENLKNFWSHETKTYNCCFFTLGGIPIQVNGEDVRVQHGIAEVYKIINCNEESAKKLNRIIGAIDKRILKGATTHQSTQCAYHAISKLTCAETLTPEKVKQFKSAIKGLRGYEKNKPSQLKLDANVFYTFPSLHMTNYT